MNLRLHNTVSMDLASGTSEGGSHTTYESARIVSFMDIALLLEAGLVRRGETCPPRPSLFGLG